MVEQVFESLVLALRRSGYQLSIEKITDDFLTFQVRAEQKKFSNPELDPNLHDLDEHNSLWIKIKDRNGDTIATIAARLCHIESLIPLCEYYEFWYGDKIRFTTPLNLVYDNLSDMPFGGAAYDGAMWVRPDHRGRGLSWILSRLCRLSAIRKWDPDWIFGFGFEAVTRARLPKSVYGYPRFGIFATGFKFPGHPTQSIYLASMTSDEAHRGAAEDLRYLTDRPDFVLGRAFAQELTAMRHEEIRRQAIADAIETGERAIAS